MVTIQEATECRCPLVYQTSYAQHLKEIVYQIEDRYDAILSWKYQLIPHSMYKYYRTFQPCEFMALDHIFNKDQCYAYGLVANPFNTNVIILDFDTDDIEVVNRVVSYAQELPEAREIDIACSSRAYGKPLGFHLYIGLDDTYNVLPIYKAGISGTCVGYNNFVLAKQEMVIRVSRRFNDRNKDRDTRILWIQGYLRKDENIWLSYGPLLLIAPLTTADGPIFTMTQTQIRPRLRLRG